MRTANSSQTSLMGSKTRSPCCSMSLYLKIASYKQSTRKRACSIAAALVCRVLLQVHELPCLYCFEDMTQYIHRRRGRGSHVA